MPPPAAKNYLNLSLDGLLGSVTGAKDSYCTACWTGDYRVQVSSWDQRQAELFPMRSEER